VLRCGAYDRRDCLTEHVSRSLPNARPGKREPGAGPLDPPRSIRADCPACGGCDKLTVSLGDSVRFVVTCHGGCDRPRIRDAIVKLGVSEDCFPPIREKRAKGKQPAGRDDAATLRELRNLLESPANGNAFRLRAAMLLWDIDAVTAADRLGIPERTRRRLLCP
jgi:hypothetical protein